MNATANINRSLIFLLVLIQTCCITKVVHSKVLGKKLWPGQGYEVHVVNNLTNGAVPLRIHCASGNTELGNHTLYPKGNFHWSFRMNYWFSTMFFCRFHWGARNRAFEVFNKHLAANCEGPYEKELGNICYWSVQEDGFWIGYANPPPELLLVRLW
ncbi:S-protein homolog 5-like [Henckelia pumila]|uniref:S-protein homolog 5-like n=1 Tax=Henckelia pumila TaxID=405737 RepID=UPI003C6E6F49